MSNPLYGQNKYDARVGFKINPGVPQAAIGTGAKTITIAMILKQILEEDPAGNATWTLPTAALAVAGVEGAEVGDCIDFYVVNSGTAGEDEDITIAAGTSGTLVGSGHCPTSWTTHDADRGGSAHFRIRFTNVTSASEAYSVYRLA